MEYNNVLDISSGFATFFSHENMVTNLLFLPIFFSHYIFSPEVKAFPIVIIAAFTLGRFPVGKVLMWERASV